MSSHPGQIRRVHINSEMDLFEMLRTLIYPILEEKLDQVFPEFAFQRVSNGWWLARDAPVSCQGFGHQKGRLAATTWGFRSLDPGTPTVFWLAYANKMQLPDWRAMPDAVRRLAEKVNHHFDWTPGEEAARAARDKFRLYHILDAVLCNAQNVLASSEGQEAREFLVEKAGFPPGSFLGMELGYYHSIRENQEHLKASGFGAEGDVELAGLMGLYQDEWEGRIVGPWRDRLGRMVFNLWGRSFTTMMGSRPEIPCLRRPRTKALLGSTDVPYGLDRALRNKRKHLVMLESPFSSLLPPLKKVDNPAFIASGGKVTAAQVTVLEKYLRDEGSLTLNLNYDPMGGSVHRSTLQALDELEGVSFPVYVVSPDRMCKEEGLIGSVAPDEVILEQGMNAYVEILRGRLEPDEYRRMVDR